MALNTTRGTERTLGQLVSDATTDLQNIVKGEIDLAKVEIKADAQKAGKGGGMLAAAGVLAGALEGVAGLLAALLPLALGFARQAGGALGCRLEQALGAVNQLGAVFFLPVVQGLLAFMGQAQGAALGLGSGHAEGRHQLFTEQLAALSISRAGGADDALAQVAVQHQGGESAHQHQVGRGNSGFFGHVYQLL